MTSLIVLSDGEKERLVRLNRGLTIIGRSPQSDLMIDDARASRRHARIRCHGAEFFIEDLESRNGTLVNGARIDSPYRLHPGDRIEIGGTRAIFDPQHATAVMMVDETGTQRIGESTSGEVALGDAGTLLPFKPGASSTLSRRDPMVRLQIIYHFADRMRRCYPLDEMLKCILDGLFEVLSPDRAAVLLANHKTGAMESVASRVSEQEQHAGAPLGPISISSSIVAKAVASRTTVVARDARTDQRFAASESIVASRIGTAVCVPMISGDELCGLLYLDFLFRLRPLEDADLELLAGLANQSAMAIGNSLHQAEEVERREMEMQLGVARRVHDRLLSHMECDVDGIRVRSVNRPSRTVGGDYLGVFPTPEGTILAVADGTGHGIGAALLMGTARAYLVALLAQDSRPIEEVVQRLNRLVYEDVDPGLFVSLGLMRIDADRRQLSGVSAGHEPPLLYRGAEGRFLELPTGGMVLGLDPEAAYTPMPPVALRSGDRIVLFTDGIVEQLNSRGEEFGFTRLKAAIEQVGGFKTEEALASILRQIDTWRGPVEQGDDFSLMIAHVD